MSQPGARHEWIDHAGEVRLRVWAASLPALFSEAGRALARLSLPRVDPGALGEWVDIRVRAPDRVALLVDWLNELIWLAETRSEVLTEIDVLAAADDELHARARGVRVPDAPALVKAATLHDARVVTAEGGYRADVILDV